MPATLAKVWIFVSAGVSVQSLMALCTMVKP